MNKELKEATILQKAGVFALVCAGLLALSGVWYMYQTFTHSNAKTFTVAGKGEIEVQATKATISADYVGEGDTSDSATQKLSDASTKVFSALKDAGVQDADIKTQNVSVNPKYEYCYSYPAGAYPAWCKNNPNQNRITGYEATQNFTITINNNKELVEKLLGLIPSLGVRNMNGPSWEVDDKAAVSQARDAAVKEAHDKAASIAKSLGMRLGDVTYYSEDNGGGNPIPMMYAKGSAVMSSRMEVAPQAADMSIPVSQGTDKVTVNVNVTYEIY